jgi:hypothetical protein
LLPSPLSLYASHFSTFSPLLTLHFTHFTSHLSVRKPSIQFYVQLICTVPVDVIRLCIYSPRGLLKTIGLFSHTSILSNYKMWKFRPTPLFSCINLRFYKRKKRDRFTEEKCKVESNTTERSPLYKMTVRTV